MPNWDKDDDFGTMDQLDYQYFDGSNRLRSVTDGILKNDTSGKGEFVDGNKDGDDYVYDPNGNMTQDLNKGIKGSTPTEKGIEYNHLNLPTLVRVHNGADVGTISYIYDATGVKLRKNVLKQGETTPTATDYAGNYVYENGTLQFFSTPEGYATSKNVNDYSAGFDYVYNYVDHLGNVRLSYMHNNGTVEIVKESNYYPFGLSNRGYNGNVSPLGNSVAKRFMFGGKEYQDDGLDLGWYDVTARNYDPALGRWMNIDPLAEIMPSHSPYNYGFNSPIYFQDYDGMMPQGPCGDKPCPKVKKLPRVDKEGTEKRMAGIGFIIAMLDGPEVGPADGAGVLTFIAGLALASGVDASIEVTNILIDNVNNMTAGEEASSSSEEASSSSEEASSSSEEATSKTKKERVETESSLEAALNQEEGIEKAQQAAKKEVKGEKQNRIQSKKKSEQRLQNELDRIDLDDLPEY